MPTVISKYLQRRCDERGIPVVYATRAAAAVVLTAYAYKVALPLIKKALLKKSGKSPDLTTLPSVPSFEVYASSNEASAEGPKKPRYTINSEFRRQLRFLFSIMIPGFFSQEVLILLVHTLTLIARTFLSIYVATLEGQVASFIVQKDLKRFFFLLGKWILVAIPATFVNSAIRFLESKMALAFQSRLTAHAYKMYFANQTYYRVSNLDTRLENADHCLTEDIAQFTSSVAHLYSHITKPLLDVILLTFSLAGLGRGMGGSIVPGPFVAAATILLTVSVLKGITPKFGKLAAAAAAKKGYLRFIHSRVIANAEEIAFYGGHLVEESHLRRSFDSLVMHMNKIFKQKLWYIMIEQFLVKYVWSAAGMVMVSIPLLTAKETNTSAEAVGRRTQFLTTSKTLLSSGADAVERLMTSYKEIVELSGYTSRVAEMFNVFEEMSDETYQRPAAMDNKSQNRAAQKIGLVFVNGAPLIQGQVLTSPDDRIVLEGVPIVTPAGDVVVPSVSLTLRPEMHLLISGPNGCGKSSLFRIISGLWPVYKGILYKPPNATLFYIPQRPYLSLGTLRDQVIYPDRLQDMIARGLQDSDLERFLDIVSLRHIVTREGGWDSHRDWKDVLSGGEKQRMGMARLFYHRPNYALLDECTSAVSIDVEGAIYEAAKEAGVTLLTITHRPSLWKFHSHVLQFDGEGGWKLDKLDMSTRLTLKEEKEKLETQLAGIPQMQDRLKELCQALGEESAVVDPEDIKGKVDVLDDNSISSLSLSD